MFYKDIIEKQKFLINNSQEFDYFKDIILTNKVFILIVEEVKKRGRKKKNHISEVVHTIMGLSNEEFDNFSKIHEFISWNESTLFPIYKLSKRRNKNEKKD